MGKPHPVPMLDVSAPLNANLELSNCCLVTASWLRRSHLPSTARLLLAMSDRHTAVAHLMARLGGSRGRPVRLQAFDPPCATFGGVVDAARQMVSREEGALVALEKATTGTIPADPRLGAGLADVLLEQRGLTRLAGTLQNAALEHSSDPARLECWSLMVEHRFRTTLSRSSLAPRLQPEEPTTTPTFATSTRSRR